MPNRFAKVLICTLMPVIFLPLPAHCQEFHAESLDDIGAMLNQVTRVATELKLIVGQIDQNLIQGGQLQQTLKTARTVLEKIAADLSSKGKFTRSAQKTLGNFETQINAIHDALIRINTPDSSLRHLLDDPEMANDLLQSLRSAQNISNKLRPSQYTLDFWAERFVPTQTGRGGILLQIQPPRHPAIYSLGLARDPRGYRSANKSTTSVNQGTPTEVTVTSEERSAWVPTVLIGAPLFSVFEVSAGLLYRDLALRISLFPRSPIELQVDLYDPISIDTRAVGIRATALAHPLTFVPGLSTLYLRAGIENLMEPLEFSVGAGIRFNDTDLRALRTMMRR